MFTTTKSLTWLMRISGPQIQFHGTMSVISEESAQMWCVKKRLEKITPCSLYILKLFLGKYGMKLKCV